MLLYFLLMHQVTCVCYANSARSHDLARVEFRSSERHEHIDFLSIKNAIVRLKARDHKAWSNKKLLHKKADAYRCGYARLALFQWMKRNAHVRQMFRVLFSNVFIIVHPPSLRTVPPRYAVTDPFLSIHRVPGTVWNFAFDLFFVSLFKLILRTFSRSPNNCRFIRLHTNFSTTVSSSVY